MAIKFVPFGTIPTREDAGDMAPVVTVVIGNKKVTGTRRYADLFVSQNGEHYPNLPADLAASFNA